MFDPSELEGKKFADFTILKRLGSGGFGHTYSIQMKQGGSVRAIKISQQKLSSNDKGHYTSQMAREVEILQQLKHTQIVTYFSHGELNGYPYLISDFIPGYSFAYILDYIRGLVKESRLPWQQFISPFQALSLIFSALQPLEYAHSIPVSLSDNQNSNFNGQGVLEQRGVAHRDVSPGNLILGSQYPYRGYVHIIDFATVKSSNDLYSQTNQMLGTTPYMAPMRFLKEQDLHLNSPYWETFSETQNDVHSMGLLLCELLCGERFINADNNTQSVVQILNKERYSKLYQEMEKFGPEILLVIKRSVVCPDLQQKNDSQYKNAGEMLVDVKKAFEKLCPAELVNVQDELRSRLDKFVVKVENKRFTMNIPVLKPQTLFQPEKKKGKLIWIGVSMAVLVILAVIFVMNYLPVIEATPTVIVQPTPQILEKIRKVDTQEFVENEIDSVPRPISNPLQLPIQKPVPNGVKPITSVAKNQLTQKQKGIPTESIADQILRGSANGQDSLAKRHLENALLEDEDPALNVLKGMYLLRTNSEDPIAFQMLNQAKRSPSKYWNDSKKANIIENILQKFSH